MHQRKKHHLLADIATPVANAFPGFSVTYSYDMFPYVNAGAGIQLYKVTPTAIQVETFVPAVYADIQFKIRPKKRNQFFAFLDMGINIYQLNNSYRYYRSSSYYVVIPHDNGFYLGTGFGYLRQMIRNGGGPYVSLKFLSNANKISGYDYAKQREIGILDINIELAISLGFKF